MHPPHTLTNRRAWIPKPLVVLVASFNDPEETPRHTAALSKEDPDVECYARSIGTLPWIHDIFCS